MGQVRSPLPVYSMLCIACVILVPLAALDMPPAEPASATIRELLPPLIPEVNDASAGRIPTAPRGSAAPVVAGFLSDPSPQARLRGIEAIEEPIGSATVETLLAGLMDDSGAVRQAAATRLNRTRPDLVIGSVWLSGIERSPDFWEHFWKAMPDLHDGLGPALHDFLKRDDITGLQAAMAAHALGLMRYEPAGDLLAERAWVRHPELARRAAEALWRLRERGPRTEQRKLLRHPLPLVRMIAIEGLAMDGDTEAAHLLHGVVLGRTERDLSVRRAAVGGLASMEMRDALPALIDLLGTVPGMNQEIRHGLIILTGVDNGREARMWREWYEAVLLHEAGRYEEAERIFEALDEQRTLRLR